MNAERLLAHYEQIADAPDAIARLRRLILDLAVRGKLVPQDAQDEPASELLKRIATEKARLVKAGEIKADKPLLPVEGEIDFDVPSNWRWTRLGVITSYIQRGKSPTYAASGGSLIVSQKCVQWTGLDLTVAKKITLNSLDDYEPVRFLREGDLLWNSTGTGTIGRVIRLIQAPKNLVCDSHVTVVRCLEVDPEYVRAWLRSGHVYGHVEERAAGSTNQIELTAQMAINQIVPLPPLAEQRRIVAKLDELMVLCDRLEASQASREAVRDRLATVSLACLHVPNSETFQVDTRFALDALPALTTRTDQIKQLRQTILNLAVRGKLDQQNAKDEPANLKAADCDERPEVIPSTWVYTRLVNLLVEDTRNGYSRKPDDAPNGIPILRISAGTLRRDGVVAEEEHKLIGGIDRAIRLQYELRSGDLLACRFNGNKAFVGRLTIFKDYLSLQPIYPDKLIRIRVSPELATPEFLRLAGDTDLVRIAVEAVCATTVGNWGISASNLKEVRFPLPPLAEQRRIVAKVDALMALCDQLEASLTTTASTRRRLLDTLLAEALAPDEQRKRQAAE